MGRLHEFVPSILKVLTVYFNSDCHVSILYVIPFGYMLFSLLTLQALVQDNRKFSGHVFPFQRVVLWIQWSL